MSKPGKGQQGRDFYSYDSTSLENAAKAAKYLDSSDNAKEAIQLAISREETKQLEYKDNTVKNEIQKAQVQEEERRKTVQYETEMSKRRAEYQVQLDLQRDQQKMQHKEQMAEMSRQADEQSTQRQEQMRRDTMEYEYQLKASLKQQALQEQMRVENEKAAQNQGFVKALFADAERDKRETQKQNIVTSFNMLGSQLTKMFQNPKFLYSAAYTSVLIFGAFHCTKLFSTVAATTLLSRFGKPQLVRETSKIYTNNYGLIPFMLMKKFFNNNIVRRNESDLLKGVILDKKLEDQLREISYAVLNRRKHYAPAKNMLFYGPPGTGKTLFAKKLATQSGLEYAVMVGSDIAPLGPMAVTEINKMFDWAEKQPNGMILFIDEADAFLRSRKGNDISEYMRHSINSFLYRTGTPSERVILVMATNNPEQLDEAIHDRIDEVVGFTKPNENERRIMLFHYLVQYCQPPKTPSEKAKFLYKYPRSIYHGKKLIQMQGIDKDVIDEIAKATDGFSGRELTKMVIAWHDAAFTLPDAVLTPEIMRNVLAKFHLQHQLKDTWTQDEQKILEKLFFASEEEMKGSTTVDSYTSKNEGMVNQQEELMDQINQSRMDMKEAGDAQASAQKIIKDNKQN